MVRSTRTLIPLLIVFLLFTVYGSADSRVGNTALSTLAIHPLASLVKPPLAVQTGITPQTLRLAYRVDSLLQKGFTGKWHTVIDLVYLSDPTLQHDTQVLDQKFTLPPVYLHA